MEVNLLNNPRVLVTGGSGFIGQHLIRELAKLNYEVWNFDIRKPKEHHQNVNFVNCDISNREEVKSKWREVDLVIHLAAEVSVPKCENDIVGSSQVNLVGTQIVAEATQRLGVDCPIIFASSSAVYGEKKITELPISESSSTQPLGIYGLQKLWSEQFLNHLCESQDLRSVCFRFFNVYGIGQDSTSPYSGVLTKFANCLSSQRNLTLYDGGQSLRDFIHVSDVVCAIIFAGNKLLTRSPIPQVMNVCSGQSISIKEVAEIVKDISIRLNMNWPGVSSQARLKMDIPYSLGCFSLAQQTLSWQPKQNFNESLFLMIKQLVETQI